jgi:hypothetical protein
MFDRAKGNCLMNNVTMASIYDTVERCNFFLQLFFKISLCLMLTLSSCTEKFLPETGEDKDLLVVEGLITDQPGQNTIKLSTSLPLGERSVAQPLSGAIVSISDDLGNSYTFVEKSEGAYVPDSLFHGVVGNSYVLHVKCDKQRNYRIYESTPMLLRPVPPIDSVYYERLILATAIDGFPTQEGAQVYLNAYDRSNSCKYYRWEFDETWQFELPYDVQNRVCYATGHSRNILIKNTSSFSEDKILRQPVTTIDNNSDRLSVKYSILVNQYSLNEEEYEYWEKLSNVTEQVGSLYDVVPNSIPGNIRCLEQPYENVLGYFSVSSVKSKRIFIKSQFRGLVKLYKDCENQIVGYYEYVPSLNLDRWLIIDHFFPPPPYKVLTFFKGCADCTVRGTTKKPSFWVDDY